MEKPSVLHILHQTLTYVCEKEEEKNLGLPFFPFYLVLPLSLWCYQFPWGRFSAAAIGRPRLSKYMF